MIKITHSRIFEGKTIMMPFWKFIFGEHADADFVNVGPPERLVVNVVNIS